MVVANSRLWKLSQDSMAFHYIPMEVTVNEYGMIEEVPTEEAWTFDFAFNPNQVQVSYKKVKQIIPTKNGFVTQHWHNSMHTFSFQGVTEPLIGPLGRPDIVERNPRQPPEWIADPKEKNLRDTPQWKMFWLLDQFIQATNRDILMYYDGAEYAGAFDGFQFTEDASDPYIVKYNFQFTAYPTKDYSTVRWFVGSGGQNGAEEERDDITRDLKKSVTGSNKSPWEKILSEMQSDQTSFEISRLVTEAQDLSLQTRTR